MAEAAGPRSLRQLVDAMLVVGSDLDLHNVLQRVVESARDLTDARYAALGMLDESGMWLSDFITVAIYEEIHRRTGALPKGRGILGVLTRDAEPLRLPDLREHAASSGFPAGHPPMRSLLGVPVQAGDRSFGNLYLGEKDSSEAFTDIDEELVVGLAAAAGIAIEEARLHSQTQDLALLDDQERIARDLHDSVIQRVFGVGLILHGTGHLVRTNPDAAIERIDAAIAADAMAMADVIANWILDMQAKAPPGSVAEELDRNADFHYVAHNAAGGVSLQLGISLTDALIRLRAYAFSHDRPLREVAEDIVARRLKFP